MEGLPRGARGELGLTCDVRTTGRSAAREMRGCGRRLARASSERCGNRERRRSSVRIDDVRPVACYVRGGQRGNTGVEHVCGAGASKGD